VRKESAVEAKDEFEFEHGGAEATGVCSAESVEWTEAALTLATLERRSSTSCTLRDGAVVFGSKLGLTRMRRIGSRAASEERFDDPGGWSESQPVLR